MFRVVHTSVLSAHLFAAKHGLPSTQSHFWDKHIFISLLMFIFLKKVQSWWKSSQVLALRKTVALDF